MLKSLCVCVHTASLKMLTGATFLLVNNIFAKLDTLYSKPLYLRSLQPPRPESTRFDIVTAEHFWVSQIPFLPLLFLASASRASATVQPLPDDLLPICSAPSIAFHTNKLTNSIPVSYPYAILFVFATMIGSFPSNISFAI